MISVQPLDWPLGASVAGLDAPALTRSEVAAELSQALERHGVLVFTSHQLRADDLSKLAAVFATEHWRLQPGAEVTNIDTGTADVRRMQRWQSTGSFLAQPPKCTVATAIQVPTRGGQFQFADMRGALKLLPPADRAEIAELNLLHTYQSWRGGDGGYRSPGGEDDTAEHSWIQHHDDGTESLFMGAGASHVVGGDVAATRQWFAEIEAQLPVHDVLYEHRWQPNDILVWDHRVTMHRMLGFDMENEPCTFRYITVGHHLATRDVRL